MMLLYSALMRCQLEYSVQLWVPSKSMDLAQAGPNEGHKFDHGADHVLPYEDRLREEKAPERTYSSLPWLKGYPQEGWGGCSDRTRGDNFKVKENRFLLDIRKNSLLWGWWDTGRGTREVMDTSSWKCSKSGWLGLWAAWSSGRCPCPVWKRRVITSQWKPCPWQSF